MWSGRRGFLRAAFVAFALCLLAAVTDAAQLTRKREERGPLNLSSSAVVGVERTKVAVAAPDGHVSKLQAKSGHVSLAANASHVSEPRNASGQVAGHVALAAHGSNMSKPGNASSQVALATHGSKVNKRRWNTFQSWYSSYTHGRGIWTWNNALDVYQRHFGIMAGLPDLKIVMAGVHSGGSLVMWRSVLGSTCQFYGVDSSPTAAHFQDLSTEIYVGDTLSPTMWEKFFKKSGPVDVLVGDIGKTAEQKYVTFTHAFPHLKPGGSVVIEDIHGEEFVESFLAPLALYLGQQDLQKKLSSIHIYPFMLVARSTGNEQKAPIVFGGQSVTVANFPQLWTVLPKYPGGHVIIENKEWGSFLTTERLLSLFRMFNGLFRADDIDIPEGCEQTGHPICSVTVKPSSMQSTVTGVHVFPTYLVVEVATTHVLLQAVRRGTEWLPNQP